MKILVIDDDAAMVDLLGDYLHQFHFEVISAKRPSEAFPLFKEHAPDLVLLDVMLPEISGFEVCRQLRALDASLPIIMLTARGEVTDRVVGLEIGADDYVAKPYEPRELVARMQSVLRRSGERKKTRASSRTFKFGPLEIDLTTQDITLAGELVALTGSEFTALRLFVENIGRPVDRDKLSTVLKGNEWDVHDRSIDILVSRLRQKLGDDSRKPRLLKTVRGSGYMLVATDEDYRAVK